MPNKRNVQPRIAAYRPCPQHLDIPAAADSTLASTHPFRINTRKQILLARHRTGQALALILSLGYLMGCAAFELEPITYQEAVSQYQEGGGIENYRCVLVPVDGQYRTLGEAKPIAVEIDNVLFVKLDGFALELQQRDINETRTLYAFEGMSARLATVNQFNQSEYNESDDRYVDFTFQSAGQTVFYKTFGTACGL
ncbi:hypothetical protein [Pseudomonas sp. GD03944]|uniref:hypothetical protein n=1 Tax=Pseudomonas sp. GD03944 TaxID=2975409 RepID=UPI00244D1C0B|nr:hypothetical protein [Pseudomonas sp. GD03944]MDH1263845.1 hypothetical protein [Pseudomonas sp. GD03944]